MDWIVTNIVWDTDGRELTWLPTEQFISWSQACDTREAAIDMIADHFGYLILSCTVTEE